MQNQVPNMQITPAMLKNADQQTCECGCKAFITETWVYKLSAIVSPVGKETVIQMPRLVCKECGEVFMLGVNKKDKAV
jgi:hypothetical protein